MRHRLLRALFTLTALAVVWLVASPAMAANASFTGEERRVSPTAPNAAPLCDPRGAIVFAPPPQIQDLEVSLDAVADDDCAAPISSRGRHATRGRAPAPIEATSSQDAATAAAALAIVRAEGARVSVPAASFVLARPGHRSTVDRPPRA
ncbi:MAG: hypothetical protein KF819_05695 [Labilithrix sp.]|nr:hypothetical protein [Labilithrix sp.]